MYYFINTELTNFNVTFESDDLFRSRVTIFLQKLLENDKSEGLTLFHSLRFVFVYLFYAAGLFHRSQLVPKFFLPLVCSMVSCRFIVASSSAVLVPVFFNVILLFTFLGASRVAIFSAIYFHSFYSDVRTISLFSFPFCQLCPLSQ